MATDLWTLSLSLSLNFIQENSFLPKTGHFRLKAKENQSMDSREFARTHNVVLTSRFWGEVGAGSVNVRFYYIF